MCSQVEYVECIVEQVGVVEGVLDEVVVVIYIIGVMVECIVEGLIQQSQVVGEICLYSECIYVLGGENLWLIGYSCEQGE